MARILVAALLAVGMVGCAGSADGTVAGHKLAVADAIFGVQKDSDGKNTFLLVALSDKANLCDSLKANRQPKSATTLSLGMFRVADLKLLAPDVGDYAVRTGTDAFSNGNTASPTFSRQDSSCANTISGNAGDGKSGIIKLTNLKAETGGTANGTFDITFGDGSLKGSFNATYCDLAQLTDNPNCE